MNLKVYLPVYLSEIKRPLRISLGAEMAVKRNNLIRRYSHEQLPDAPRHQTTPGDKAAGRAAQTHAPRVAHRVPADEEATQWAPRS